MIEIIERQDGTSLAATNDGRLIAVARKQPAGWIVDCKSGRKPWPYEGVIASLAGRPTGRTIAKTKRQAKRLMKECE